MIAFAPTIARLKEAGCRHVEGVLEFVGLVAAPRVSPAFFLVPERDSAQPNRMAGVHDQKVTETFSVVIVIEAARASGAASEALQAETERVEQALCGWRHPQASGGCELVGARLLSVEGQRVAWAISFSASRHIRRSSQ